MILESIHQKQNVPFFMNEPIYVQPTAWFCLHTLCVPNKEKTLKVAVADDGIKVDGYNTD